MLTKSLINPVSASASSSREYYCESGTRFLRRDSLISHQLFSDAVSIKEDLTAIAMLSPVSKQPKLQLAEQDAKTSVSNNPQELAVADPFEQSVITSVSNKPRELNVADPFEQSSMTSVSNKPRELNVADPFEHSAMTFVSNKPRELNVADPFEQSSMTSVSSKPQELNVADPFAHTTMPSVSTRQPQECNVADSVAQIDMHLREALTAGTELMENLKLSGSENDLAASELAEQVILSAKRVQKLLPVKKEMMFRKELLPMDLTPSGVSKLKCLPIPKVFAEKYFPKLLSSIKSILLNFEDLTGKLWTFQYSYWNTYQCYILAEGWSRFVEEKQLSVGDTVFFYRGVGGEDRYKFFIHWSRRGALAKQFLGNALLFRMLNSPPNASYDEMDADDVHAPFTPFPFTPSPLTPYPFTPSPLTPYPFTPSPTLSDGLIVDDALAPYFHSLSPNHCSPCEADFDGVIADKALRYCALFPHNYEFEKETVIQLWMAHGVFVREPMEGNADFFFENWLTRGYFLFCQTNLVTGKAMYKFKRDCCLFPLSILSGNHVVLIEGNSNLNDVSVEVSHVSIRCYTQKNSTVFQELKRFKHLRTLMFLRGHDLSFKQVPRDFFLSLKLLQVLDLSQTCLLELPSSIGNLKCLRYLDLSETLIKRLPAAIDCLENLLTLKLRGCLNLTSLPKGMNKLVNLRHLELDVRRQLRSMPPGLGTLTNIQTLSAFLVDLEDECSIRQLQNMNNLSGNFCICRLENVLTKDEAIEACLCYKSKLTKLELQWSDSQNEDVSGSGEVLSSLVPNTSLEELHISCFDGFDLPGWICDPAFSKLVRITLFKCENCLVLPSLGQLPSLKFLNILDFHKLKVIDHNFYGWLDFQGVIAFPKLEKLAIENMLSLEEWSGMEKSVFPCLLKLTIKYCPKLCSLNTLSNLSFLKYLEISHCDMLESWTDGRLPPSVETLIIEDCPMISVESLKNGGQDWHKVAHIQSLWVDNQEIPSGAAE